MAGASHRGLNCSEPQTTVGVLTVPFSSQDIRALESSKGHGKSLTPLVFHCFPQQLVQMTPPSAAIDAIFNRPRDAAAILFLIACPPSGGDRRAQSITQQTQVHVQWAAGDERQKKPIHKSRGEAMRCGISIDDLNVG